MLRPPPTVGASPSAVTPPHPCCLSPPLKPFAGGRQLEARFGYRLHATLPEASRPYRPDPGPAAAPARPQAHANTTVAAAAAAANSDAAR